MSTLLSSLSEQLKLTINAKKDYLDGLVQAAYGKIADTEKLAAALTSRAIPATAHAMLEEDGVWTWVCAKAATIPDIEEALARSDIRVTHVTPHDGSTVIDVQGHHGISIYVAHADIPAPYL